MRIAIVTGGYTYNEAVKEIRAAAKNHGLTFKRQNLTINDKQAWMFTDRLTGEVKGKNYHLWSAYESMLNGDLLAMSE